ncbi:MAG TPA: TIGR04348 family glycosyltransferase, partial [Gammaproteobacteria bacterium]|nr:TIGR04348 family glycosyltransferase [Gammaproteobacteria bacterium]
MKISLITPAGKQSRSGNRTTAVRWARLLRELGHRVRMAEAYDGGDADLMVAIHAWRSAESIERFYARHPDRPLVVVLAGTDVYRYQQSEPETVCRSMELATTLVGLHELVHRSIPDRFGSKLQV